LSSAGHQAVAAPLLAEQPLAKKLPRWRGFNLLEKFNGQNKRFAENDFAWIHEWGFDFVRLPMDYKASWANGDRYPLPTWPLKEGNKITDRDTLYRNQILPWKKLAARGVGVHVGEWGAFNKTPHDVVRRWATDLLGLWKEAGWGWALWNFRGEFGILDSRRADVRYEDFHGHKLDRELLEVLLRG
jgi:aryl-phospho-beta-D-glucosidase BglC (GH1 family)